MKAKKINRRSFLATSSTGIVGVGASASFIKNMSFNDNHHSVNDEEIKIKAYRTLGRTGFKVSDIGCGPVSISNENLLRLH